MLVRMHDDVISLKNRLPASQNIEVEISYDSTMPLPRYAFKRNEKCPHKTLLTIVGSNVSHNSQNINSLNVYQLINGWQM